MRLTDQSPQGRKYKVLDIVSECPKHKLAPHAVNRSFPPPTGRKTKLSSPVVITWSQREVTLQHMRWKFACRGPLRTISHINLLRGGVNTKQLQGVVPLRWGEGFGEDVSRLEVGINILNDDARVVLANIKH